MKIKTHENKNINLNYIIYALEINAIKDIDKRHFALSQTTSIRAPRDIILQLFNR